MTTGLVVRPAGECALLAELPDARSALALYSRLRASPASPPTLPGVVDVVPAERTVLVTFDPVRVPAAAVRRWLEAAAAGASGVADDPGRHSTGTGAPPLEIAVHYDGPDLDDVAHTLGMSADEVIAAHTASVYTAAFIGFAPGFAYLTGGDERIVVPRRAEPRAAVPAGSVALAAGYCGVYPRESPGGWQLIGRADAALWDERRTPPALITPGTTVRFVRA